RLLHKLDSLMFFPLFEKHTALSIEASDLRFRVEMGCETGGLLKPLVRLCQRSLIKRQLPKVITRRGHSLLVGITFIDVIRLLKTLPSLRGISQPVIDIA